MDLNINQILKDLDEKLGDHEGDEYIYDLMTMTLIMMIKTMIASLMMLKYLLALLFIRERLLQLTAVAPATKNNQM